MAQLAIKGGKPVKGSIGAYAAWPVSTEEMERAAVEALDSGVWGTLGPKSAEFAEKYAEYTDCAYCLPVTNGTESLQVVLRALEVGRGDEVIVPPYTFSGTIAAVIMCGAAPVFADIDPGTYNISPKDIERVITDKTKAIIGVHLGGRPFDIDAVSKIAKERGLFLIEDAAHAHGSMWRGKKAGSFGDAGSFSFQASKNLPGGEAGAVTTNDRGLYEKMWSIHNNGRGWGERGYCHPFLGTNLRMGEWQAAVLLEGLKRLEADIGTRMRNAAMLDEAFKDCPFLEVMEKSPNETKNSLHMYTFKYIKEGLGDIPRHKFIEALAAENTCAPSSGYSLPIYDMHIFKGDEYKKITGREFESPKAYMAENEKAAHEEGMWLYQSSLLGSAADTEAIIESVDKIYKNKDEL